MESIGKFNKIKPSQVASQFPKLRERIMTRNRQRETKVNTTTTDNGITKLRQAIEKKKKEIAEKRQKQREIHNKMKQLIQKENDEILNTTKNIKQRICKKFNKTESRPNIEQLLNEVSSFKINQTNNNKSTKQQFS